jgi:hypothetical protein
MRIQIIKKVIIALVIAMILPVFSYSEVSATEICDFKLVTQKSNTLYPFKVEKKGSLVTFITIQDKGKVKLIAFGGQYFQFDPVTKSFLFGEKPIPVKPKNLDDAVLEGFKVWAKSQCR